VRVGNKKNPLKSVNYSDRLLGAQKSPLMLRACEPLPCGAIPTRFVIDEPECADKLLRSMNVTNVRVLPAEAHGSAH